MKRKFWSGFTSVMLAVAFLLQAGNLAWKMYQGKQPQAAIAPAKQYARVQMDWNAVKLESNVWKIHREGQADSYLLGTYHIGKKGDAMNPALKDLIARNQKIITEVVSEPPEAEIKNLAQNAMRSNVPLTEKMGRRPFDALVRKMNTYPEGKSLSQNLKYVKPWAGVLFVMGLRDKDEDGNTGAESFIYRETARLGKEHGALETHTEATMYFALIPDDLAVAMLNDWVAHSEDSEESKALEAAYRQGEFSKMPALHAKEFVPDPDGKTTSLTLPQQEAVNEWFVQDLLIARNKNWLPKMKQEMAQQPTLFAVGAAHLMGSQGLIALLRQEGYTVTPEPGLKVWR